MPKAKWQKKPQDLSKKISVVIITKDRLDGLVKTLKLLLCLPEKFPIIVINNNSSDNTPKIVTELFSSVTLVNLNKNLGSAGRNIGAKLAKTPLIAFCDDDSFWATGSLTKAVNYFRRYPRLAILQSKILIYGKKVDPNCQDMLKNNLKTKVKLPGPLILGFLACGAVVRKKAFLEAGGFYNHFGVGGEEGVLAVDLLKNGWGLSYTEDVISYHFPYQARDLDRRKQVQIRNWLWFIWLRRPLSVSLKTVFGLFKEGSKNPYIWQGFTEALKELPWILKHRKVVPSDLEIQLKIFYG